MHCGYFNIRELVGHSRPIYYGYNWWKNINDLKKNIDPSIKNHMENQNFCYIYK